MTDRMTKDRLCEAGQLLKRLETKLLAQAAAPAPLSPIETAQAVALARELFSEVCRRFATDEEAEGDAWERGTYGD